MTQIFSTVLDFDSWRWVWDCQSPASSWDHRPPTPTFIPKGHIVVCGPGKGPTITAASLCSPSGIKSKTLSFRNKSIKLLQLNRFLDYWLVPFLFLSVCPSFPHSTEDIGISWKDFMYPLRITGWQSRSQCGSRKDQMWNSQRIYRVQLKSTQKDRFEAIATVKWPFRVKESQFTVSTIIGWSDETSAFSTRAQAFWKTEFSRFPGSERDPVEPLVGGTTLR